MNKMIKVALFLALTGCSSYDSSAYMGPGTSGTGTVNVNASSFSPTTVYPDGTGGVTWTFKSAVTHNIVFEAAGITGSGDQNSGSFSRNFSTPGTYRFRCTIHSTDFTHGMTGRVILPDPGSGGGGGYPTEGER